MDKDQKILAKALRNRDVKTFSEKFSSMIDQKIKEKTQAIFKDSISSLGIEKAGE